MALKTLTPVFVLIAPITNIGAKRWAYFTGSRSPRAGDFLCHQLREVAMRSSLSVASVEKQNNGTRTVL